MINIKEAVKADYENSKLQLKQIKSYIHVTLKKNIWWKEVLTLDSKILKFKF